MHKNESGYYHNNKINEHSEIQLQQNNQRYMDFKQLRPFYCSMKITGRWKFTTQDS